MFIIFIIMSDNEDVIEEFDDIFECVEVIKKDLERYDRYIEYLWNKVVVDYSRSMDCNLDLDIDDINAKRMFRSLMKNTSYYKQLNISLRNFERRVKLLRPKYNEAMDRLESKPKYHLKEVFRSSFVK